MQPIDDASGEVAAFGPFGSLFGHLMNYLAGARGGSFAHAKLQSIIRKNSRFSCTI